MNDETEIVNTFAEHFFSVYNDSSVNKIMTIGTKNILNLHLSWWYDGCNKKLKIRIKTKNH